MAKGTAQVSMVDFLKAHETSNCNAEVAEKTGLTIGSVQARASNYRKRGWPLKHFKRGGGTRINDADALALLAELRGVDVADLTPATTE